VPLDRRNHIGNAVREDRACDWDGERGVIGLYDRKAGVGADKDLLNVSLGLHLTFRERIHDDENSLAGQQTTHDPALSAIP
jgi:hypothetical protein